MLCVQPLRSAFSTSAAVKRIGPVIARLVLVNFHLSIFHLSPIPLHIAALETPLAHLNFATVSFRFVNLAGRRHQTRATFDLCTTCQLIVLVHVQVRHPFRTTPSRRLCRYWILSIFTRFSYVLAPYFRLSTPALSSNSPLYLNLSRLASFHSLSTSRPLSHLEFLICHLRPHCRLLAYNAATLSLVGPQPFYIFSLPFPPFCAHHSLSPTKCP